MKKSLKVSIDPCLCYIYAYIYIYIYIRFTVVVVAAALSELGTGAEPELDAWHSVAAVAV